MNPMQGQRSTIDSSVETVNNNEGSVSSVNSQTALSNRLNQIDSRFSYYAVPSGASSYMNSGGHDVESFNEWSSSEPSSSSCPLDQVSDTGIKMEHGLSSDSFHAHPGYRSDERQLDPTGSTPFPGGLHIGHGGNQVRSGSLFLRGSSSNHMPQTVNLNLGHMGDRGNSGQNPGDGVCPSIGGSSFGSSSQAREDNNGGPGSSLGGWGSSCKRKALEGSSGHSFAGGSSGSFAQVDNGIWHPGSSHYGASSSLSPSRPSQNSPNPDQPATRYGIAIGGVAGNAFPSTRSADSSSGPFGRRLLTPPQQQESVPFSFPSAENAMHSSVSSLPQSPVSASFADPLDVRSTTPTNANPNAFESQPNAMHISALSRNVHQFPWNGASSSRTGNSLGTLTPGERFIAPWEDLNVRSVPRNNTEHRMFAPATEMRNAVQDPTIWGLPRGNSSASGDASFASRAGSSSGIHGLPTPAWVPSHNTSIHNPPRISELAPWSLFPSILPEPASFGGSFPLLPTDPANSSAETAMPSGSNSRGHRHRPRRSSLLLERQGEDVLRVHHSGRSLAADNDGRHRLLSEIRQVLNAMRRGENLRIEDYMLFDPLIYHGMAEIHDRHRDMRLDVDNMSYEELLALEERIGNVNTGLSEETILKVMKQHKYTRLPVELLQDVEPCCICQEEYAEEDDIGALDCGHDFHTNCIKQWIMLKNICPICKTKALAM